MFQKYKYILAIDALLMFCNRMNAIIGKDVNKLFGVEGIQLRKSEVFYNDKKGVTCSFDNTTADWPIGKIVLDAVLNVGRTLHIDQTDFD